MIDAFNKEVKVGDKVVYIRKEYSNGPVKLAKATVKDIVGRVIKLSNHHFGVTSQSVMKLEE